MSTIEAGSVAAIAKKDFRDSIRSWTFWGLSAFFFLLIGLSAFAIGYFGNANTSTADFLATVSQITRLVIPLIALMLGWKAVAGERESGSIKIMLSLPHSRKDVIVGKLFGRTAVLSLSLLVGFAIGAVIVAVMLSTFDVVNYTGFVAMTIFYGAAYLGIAIALSSLTKSTSIAGAAMFGVFVIFYIVWHLITVALWILAGLGYISPVEYTSNGGQFTRLPDWGLFIQMIDPGNAYENVLTVLDAAATTGTQFSTDAFSGGLPFYLEDWFSFVILLGWIAIPIAIALFRFDRVDL